MKLEHKPGRDLIYELAVNMYPSLLECFREATANAFDEGTKKIKLDVSNNEVSFEDFGEGIADVDKFVTFGHATKAGLGGEIIGEKGLGKLSLLRLAKKINFRSNNGEYGINLIMTPQDFDYEAGSATKFLAHKGTRIVIPNPEGIPPIEELANYLKKAFGLRLAKGAQIILNNVPLELGPRKKLDPAERLVCRLKGSIDVTGNIQADKKGRGSLDIYIKHVFVSSVIIDPERRFSGWVNCNKLTPTTARNDIVDDKKGYHQDLLKQRREYVTKFPKIEEEISKEEISVGNELNKLMENWLKDMKLIPEGMLLLGKGNEQSLDQRNKKPKEKSDETKENKENEYIKKYSQPKTNKPIKRTQKTNYGIRWVDQNIGNSQQPIFFIEPNIIVRNRTNDLYRFAVLKKRTLGIKSLRLIPYLARVAALMNPKSKKWTIEETFLEIDKAARHFLAQQGYLN